VLLAWHGWVPVDALWVNLVVTPLVSSVVVPISFVGAAATWMVPVVGTGILSVCGRAVAACADLLHWIANQPPYALVVGQLPIAAAVVGGLGMLVAVGSRGRWRAIAVGAILVALSLLTARGIRPSSNALRIHFIPVGQGDATLVEFPSGETMLVDAAGQSFGSDPGRRVVAPYLRRLGIGRIDWLIATHPDADHIGGIPAVAERLRPRAFLFDPAAQAGMARALAAAAESGARLEPVSAEERWTSGGASVRFLRPNTDSGASDNNRSLVGVVEYGGRRVVLPGDVEAAAERSLARDFSGPVALLKVPHHGSKTSSTGPFLDTLRPRVGVVSAGRFNPFGHPHDRVRRRYERRGIGWFTTPRNGLIRARLEADGAWTVRVARRATSSLGHRSR